MIYRHMVSFLLVIMPVGNLHAEPVPIPKAPIINATSYVLVDHNTGSVLVEKNPDARSDPASITKIMTSYVIFKLLKQGMIQLEDQVLISEKAWRAIGSRMFVEVGKQVSIDHLLQGIVVQSGNDASIALAEHIAGNEEAFVKLMNEEAARLGLNSSHFMNATGLTHEQHYMTARDIAVLSSAIIRDFPQEYSRYQQKEFTFNEITQHNRNKLLWRDPSVDGLKTGHTEAAKYCLASSAQRDDMRLVAVVLGTPSEEVRANHSQALLDYGFRFFTSHQLYSAGQKLLTKRIWFGEKKKINLGVSQDVLVTIPRGQYNDLQPFLEVQAKLEAPMQTGQVVGKLAITLDQKRQAELDLVALETIAEGNFIRKAADFMLDYFE